MSAIESKKFSIYRTCIEQVMNGDERLPSLPDVTLKIRRAATDESTTIKKLCELISRDPSLSVVVMHHSRNAMFKTLAEAKDLEGAVRMMGVPYVANLIMMHSIKSLFINNNPQLRALFAISWKRQALKASMSRFLAQQLKFQTPDEAFISSLLTDLGTLAILSSLSGLKEVPDQRSYLTLCRHYSRSLGIIILRKWGMDESYIHIARECGNWELKDGFQPAPISALDIVNLGIYHTSSLLKRDSQLPPLDSLEVYELLPSSLNQLNKKGLLAVVTNNLREIVDAAQVYH